VTATMLQRLHVLGLVAISLLLTPAALTLTAQTASTPPKLGSPAEVLSSFRITGVVVNGLTGEPIQRSRLTATSLPAAGTSAAGTGRAGDPLTTQTDAKGRFEIPVPSTGMWELAASATGFRSQPYEEHEGYFSAVVLSAAVPRLELTFKLYPDATIDGFVLDEAGEPVRQAQLTLLAIPPAAPGELYRPPHPSGYTTADDRGDYEFPGVAPGEYLVSVSARPWYASAAIISHRGATDTAPDPLDVVYPKTWYPGVTDFSAATPMLLEAGDKRRADFRLQPVPSYHVRIPIPPDANSAATGRGTVGFSGGAPPTIRELSPDGTQNMSSAGAFRFDQGEWEISGIGPGTYQINAQGNPAEAGTSSLLQIGSGAPRILDVNSAMETAQVTIALDGAANADNIGVGLIDIANGRANFAQQPGAVQPEQRPNPNRSDNDNAARHERTMQLLPGHYEVVLTTQGDLHLAAISATGAEAVGRNVTLPAGSSRLLLHLTNGFGSVSGIATFADRPALAATVLLIPATLGDPASLTEVRRDQTNTDGSFLIDRVLPGAYILLAIDHGWTINWSDSSTLSRYLLHGVAVDLIHPAVLKQNVEAQAP
jgi:Carboxypeptidase regulatory-like domain